MKKKTEWGNKTNHEKEREAFGIIQKYLDDGKSCQKTGNNYLLCASGVRFNRKSFIVHKKYACKNRLQQHNHVNVNPDASVGQGGLGVQKSLVFWKKKKIRNK